MGEAAQDGRRAVELPESDRSRAGVDSDPVASDRRSDRGSRGDEAEGVDGARRARRGGGERVSRQGGVGRARAAEVGQMKRTLESEPFLSWCLVVRNAAKTLEPALASLRARTPQAEIV